MCGGPTTIPCHGPSQNASSMLEVAGSEGTINIKKFDLFMVVESFSHSQIVSNVCLASQSSHQHANNLFGTSLIHGSV